MIRIMYGEIGNDIKMKVIQKRDIVIIFILLFIAFGISILFSIGNKKSSPKAEIYYGNKLLQTIALDKKEDKLLSFPQNEEVVFHLYEDGSICFEKSDCKDQICVQSGRLYQTGESAVCLPNQFVLKLVQDEVVSSNVPDFIP